MFRKKIIIMQILLLIFLTIGMVYASDNSTDDITLDDQTYGDETVSGEVKSIENQSSQAPESVSSTEIETEDVMTYYKEKSELVSYLKDSNNQPVCGKKVSISINDKIYNRISDNTGKIVLKLNLKPGTYTASIKFDGDENYDACSANAIVKVNKVTLDIKTKNYKTYFESDLFFKAKITNKVTKKPVEGVKIAFKVFNGYKYKIYYGTTDSNGVAKLKKNFKVGTYKVVTSLKKNKYLKAKKSKSTLTVKETAEMGCTSLYLQVSGTESVAGFRRDATNAKTLHIVKYKLNGILAVKQYKTKSYFFHLITASNGWMAGTGGWDNPTINHAIEKFAGKMFKSGKIKKSYLKKIQRYEKQLKIGHFSIKAPDGRYAIVWGSGIKTGKLHAGEYISVPNAKSCYRHGTYTHFDKNPVKAAIKIAATDSFGVNRRDATAFHWKADTSEGKTTSTLKVYVANDNGHMMGRNTGHLKDNVKFRGKFISKNSLPKTPSSKFLGTVKFGNIDKLFKKHTTVKLSDTNTKFNTTNFFKVSVKSNNKPVKNLVLKLKINSKTFKIKTDSKGVAKFNTKSLSVGKYKVKLYTDNINYFVSSKSTIHITE